MSAPKDRKAWGRDKRGGSQGPTQRGTTTKPPNLVASHTDLTWESLQCAHGKPASHGASSGCETLNGTWHAWKSSFCGVILVFPARCRHARNFVRRPVLRAGSRAILNVRDTNGVPQGDVEDYVELELTDEPVEKAVDASQLRSEYINIAAAHHQFTDGAPSTVQWHKGTRRTGEGTHHTTRTKLT